MKSSFNDLGITPPILKAIDEMGFEVPTEVQSKAIPHILNQEDLIVMSKTGSGKTAVFGVSMLQMTDPEAAGPQGLILTPTRELAVQIDSDITKMSKHLQHKITAVYGQHNMNVEIQALNKGVSIIAGTPGRVFDHISHGNLITKNIRFLVLDEADRMLDMGFLDQVVRIIKTLPKNRITLLFSATMPTEIRKISREYMKNPVTIEIESQTKTVDTTKQVYYRVNHNEKNLQLNRLLLIERPESCMIFCNTRIAVDRVQSFLSKKGYGCEALHGDIPQARRLKTIEQFKQGEFHLLVATDVAARGIHIDSLSLVINYDVPTEKDSYVHRIGRTGRAGNVGQAITMVTSEDIMSLYEIEEHIGAMIPEAELPTEALFNEYRAEADQWIQSNSIKSKPTRTTQESTLKESPKKRPHSKPPQQQEKNRDRSVKANTEHKKTDRLNTVHQSEYKKPEGSKTGTSKIHTTVQPTANTNAKVPSTSSTTANINVPPTSGATAHSTVRSKTVRTSTRTVTSQSSGTNVGHTKGPIELAQSQATTTKKSLLQRILQRILGK